MHFVQHPCLYRVKKSPRFYGTLISTTFFIIRCQSSLLSARWNHSKLVVCEQDGEQDSQETDRGSDTELHSDLYCFLVSIVQNMSRTVRLAASVVSMSIIIIIIILLTAIWLTPGGSRYIHVQITTVHSTSLHFTYLRSFHTWRPLLVTTFFTLFLNVFSLQGEEASRLAGSWFQLLMVLFNIYEKNYVKMLWTIIIRTDKFGGV